MRLVLCGGGTGGHVYPLLVVASRLKEREEDQDNMKRSQVLFIGSARGPEGSLAARWGLPFASIATGALRVGTPWGLALGLSKLAAGMRQATALLSRFQAQAILASGGYVSAPVVLAAYLRRLPILIFLPDVIPGWAIRRLARLATKIAVTTARSTPHLPKGKVVESGYPVRPTLFKLNKTQARQSLGLDPQAKTLVVLGGSQGARSINRALRNHLDDLLQLCQIIHPAGARDEPWLRRARQALPYHLQRRYFLYDYLHQEYPAALVAADLALARAGASVLGELPAAGLPSILVPYPYAGGHQHANASLLREAAAAKVLPDAHLENLLPTLRSLLGDETALSQMAQRARDLARPQAANRILDILEEMIGARG